MIARALQRAVAEAWPDTGPVFVAVSGGLDSMVLLAAVSFVARDKSTRPTVLHVNHGLRGAESDADEAFVAQAAAGLGLGFATRRLVWEGVSPSQARCRERRLAFFQECGGTVFLGHHLDDQAETVLLRLLRGTGLRGLAAMSVASEGLRRPFLPFSKAQLKEAANDWGLQWREDSSNGEAGYERNWVRLELLPLLEARRPGQAARLAALAAEAASLPAPALAPVFEGGSGWRLVRAAELGGAGALSKQFSLSRKHATALAELLAKRRGQLTAERRRFHLSCGTLLVEEAGARFAAELEVAEENGARTVRSPLGQWSFPGDGRLGSATALGLGDWAKKEFQARRVPVFFRPAVPFQSVSPATRPAWPLEPGLGWAPSALGRWWFSASAASGAPAAGSAKTKKRR